MTCQREPHLRTRATASRRRHRLARPLHIKRLAALHLLSGGFPIRLRLYRYAINQLNKKVVFLFHLNTVLLRHAVCLYVVVCIPLFCPDYNQMAYVGKPH